LVAKELIDILGARLVAYLEVVLRFEDVHRDAVPQVVRLQHRIADQPAVGLDVRAHCHVFFPWYNTEHHQSGLGLLTPSDVHHGLAEQRVAARAAVLATAYGAHPERFPGGLPQPSACPTEVWINPPAAGSPNIAPGGRSRPALSSGAMIASRREGV
jgi:hypothetical protein